LIDPGGLLIHSSLPLIYTPSFSFLCVGLEKNNMYQTMRLFLAIIFLM
jgi:hypothetical protein